MHSITFMALVPHDDNRIVDGGDLRTHFARDSGLLESLDEADTVYPDITIFEVLLAFARRAAFMVDWPVRQWFMTFIRNLELERYSDEFCLGHTEWPIDRRLKAFNNRSYGPDGRGGLFPLRYPKEDQRKVELWYQMGAFMTENNMY